MPEIPIPKPVDPLGKLTKMLITAHADDNTTDVISFKGKELKMEVLINPESYTMDYKLKYEDIPATGNSAKHLKYQYTEAREMTFDFLFDSTGIIDGKRKNDIVAEISHMHDVLYTLNGETHEPPLIKLVWGEKLGLFKGKLTSLNIQYKLFNSDGTPIRAIAKATFKESMSDEERAAKDGKESPDLTHIRTVKSGETLPLLCHQIYGDSKYYLEVARYNQLIHFRNMKPGTEIHFPPLSKTQTTTP